MSDVKRLSTLNISISSVFGCVSRQICPYLKVLKMLIVCHYTWFEDHEVYLFSYSFCMNGTATLEDTI